MLPRRAVSFLTHHVVRVCVFALLLVVPGTARAQAAAAGASDKPQTCVQCHARETPSVVRDYTAGDKWRRARISCETCHGNDHEKILKSHGEVPDEICARCHAPIYREHTEGGHTYGTDAAALGTNWDRNIRSPHYSQFAPEVRRVTCDPCHIIAGSTVEKFWNEADGRFVDESAMKRRSGCSQCHPAHAYSLAEARRPEACTVCHTGAIDPSVEAYRTSSHGALYNATGAEWDWTVPLKTAKYRAPTCQYCHMRVVDDKGVSVTHNMTRKISWGMGLDIPGAGDRPHAGKRREMIRVCSECHTPRFGQDYLESADKVRHAVGSLVRDGKKILEGLYEDKILDFSHRRPSPTLLGSTHTFTASSRIGLLWPMGLFYDVAKIERAYYNLAVDHGLTAFKGAFHMSPSQTWWAGLVPAHEDLVVIRAEDHSLRTYAKVRRYSLVGIAMGGLALVIFLFAPRQRRRRPGIEL